MPEAVEEVGAKSVGPDALASHIALDTATAAEAREYLRRQNDIALLQIENLKKQDEFETSHLRWRRFNDQMSGALQMMLAAIGLLIVVGIGSAIWNAANDRGLVIDAFSVPPDLAGKGLTGEVIANKVLDKLSDLQAQTGSARASTSYANNWGDDIKVQIPNTGVSISEFNRALHQWLGHETHIGGEVYRTADGLAITARAGNQSTPLVKGSEADADALVEKVAENVYRVTQPYRYAAWLSEEGRAAESSQMLLSIAATTNDPVEKGWAYNGMAHNTIITGAVAASQVWVRKAIAADPALALPRSNFVGGETAVGHDEQALAATHDALKVMAAGDPTMDASRLSQSQFNVRTTQAQLIGDGAALLDIARQQATIDAENGRQNVALACAMLHDAGCFREALATWEPATDVATHLNRQNTLQLANALLGRWDAVLKGAQAFHDVLLHASPYYNGFLWTSDAPFHALAAAHTGDLSRARNLIEKTPGDCLICLRVRAQVEALAGNARGADMWFARAEAAAPSIGYVDADWGAVLLARGDTAGAIAKFESANKKSPHLADPLEMWGEALMLQNRSDLALTKFEEAARYAPNWGRLHLRWGEALHYASNEVEAKKQFAIAAALWLIPAEKSERAAMKTKHG